MTLAARVRQRLGGFTLDATFESGGRLTMAGSVPARSNLLEQIAALGSISAGARQMNMSYKRAWDLVEEMNRLFGKPVVAAQKGGKHGGGAQLTAVGSAIVSRFCEIERAAASAAARHIAELQAEIRGTLTGHGHAVATLA